MAGLETLEFVYRLFSSLRSFMELKLYFPLEPHFHCVSDNRAVIFLKTAFLKSSPGQTLVYSRDAHSCLLEALFILSSWMTLPHW